MKVLGSKAGHRDSDGDAQVFLTDSSYVLLEPHSQGCGGLARVFWVLRGPAGS